MREEKREFLKIIREKVYSISVQKIYDFRGGAN